MPTPSEPELIAVARKELGRQLAALRKAAGYSQTGFAPLTGYGRSTLGNVETGRQNVPRDFWRRCAAELGAPDLLAAYDEIDGMVTAERRIAAERSRAAREQMLAWQSGGPRTRVSLLLDPMVNPDINRVHGAEAPSSWYIRAAALDSSEQASMIGSAVLDPVTTERLHAEVRHLATDYMTKAPATLFTSALAARDSLLVLIGRTRRPEQLAELYFLAGVACGLLSEVSLDLGYSDAAAHNAHAAWVYGETIGDDGLRAWARGMQAVIAFWSGRPDEALAAIRRADARLAAGPQGIRLRSLEARTWSHLGNHEMTRQAIHDAQVLRVRGDHGSVLDEEIGGVFAWGEGRQDFCAASALLQLAYRLRRTEDADTLEAIATQALRHAHQALAMLTSGPDTDRSPTIEASARADLATAEVILGDLDNAEADVRQVVSLPAGRRTQRVIRRVTTIGLLLADRPYDGSPRARRIRDEVAEFVVQSAQRELPSLR